MKRIVILNGAGKRNGNTAAPLVATAVKTGKYPCLASFL